MRFSAYLPTLFTKAIFSVISKSTLFYYGSFNCYLPIPKY